ncbi:MoaD/ThiS family protein [Candidatus Bipolaricaulota bacterium]|nr:MoaD/ThiS family protein [Candidatus Bipolaricaulota bacterium]
MTGQIEVDLLLFATLRRRGLKSQQRITLQASTSVRGVAEALAIPQGEIHLVFINGRAASFDQDLQDGDRLALFPAIGGG